MCQGVPPVERRSSPTTSPLGTTPAAESVERHGAWTRASAESPSNLQWQTPNSVCMSFREAPPTRHARVAHDLRLRCSCVASRRWSSIQREPVLLGVEAALFIPAALRVSATTSTFVCRTMLPVCMCMGGHSCLFFCTVDAEHAVKQIMGGSVQSTCGDFVDKHCCKAITFTLVSVSVVTIVQRRCLWR